MKIFTIFGLLIALVAVIFALQNSAPVFVSFFGWYAQESMALILLCTFALGVIFGLSLSLPTAFGRMRKISQLQRQVKEQAHELENITRRPIDGTAQPTVMQHDPHLPEEQIRSSDPTDRTRQKFWE